MIQLRLNAMTGTGSLLLGPAPYFRIDGLLLREGPHGQVVGRYHDHHWEVSGRYVSSYQCSDRVCIRFEDREGKASTPYGPFREARFPNGCCYADQSLFAELVVDTGCWWHRSEGSRWPSLVISAAQPFPP
jgi:hypothetical protein